MLQLLTGRNLIVVLVVVGLGYGFVVQNTWAAEEVGIVGSTRNSMNSRRPSISAQNVDIVDLVIRIERMERQLKYILKQTGKNLTVSNIAREAQELASDAWTLAVEARSIAVRAEGKIDRANK